MRTSYKLCSAHSVRSRTACKCFFGTFSLRSKITDSISVNLEPPQNSLLTAGPGMDMVWKSVRIIKSLR